MDRLAFFRLGKIRTFGEVVHRNPLTTLVELTVPGYTEEEFVDLMIHGTSIYRHTMELKEAGLTHSAIIKRHNLKHNVVFLDKGEGSG